MLKKLVLIVILVAAAVAATLWAVSAPEELPDSAFADLAEPDVENGRLVFAAAGCASCHAAEEAENGNGEESGGEPVLSGGLALQTEFGTFYTPNISPSPEGIGEWNFEQFANAMLEGVAPSGGHLYPAFPYASYALMDIGDVNDLWGYLQTLPASGETAPANEMDFPYNFRRAVGLWKYLYMPDSWRHPMPDAGPEVTRGQYLVEAVGHCAECHTPRTALGGLDTERWLQGAPNPEGEGEIPSIAPGGAIDDWSVEDLAYYFESGFTPDFDVVGGSMSEVQQGLAQLPASDREAIAAYLKALGE